MPIPQVGDIIKINESSPYYWYYTQYFYGRHGIVFGYNEKLPLEITIISLVLVCDLLFILNHLIRKSQRGDSVNWIPFSVVFVCFISVLGIEFINYNNYGQTTGPTIQLPYWDYFLYCVIINVILEAFQRIIPILLIANVVTKTCQNVTPQNEIEQTNFGNQSTSEFHESTERTLYNRAVNQIKTLSRELSILLTIFVIFVLGTAMQAFLVSFFKETVTVVKTIKYDNRMCIFLSYEITYVTSAFDIASLSVLHILSLVKIIKTRKNVLTFVLNIMVTLLKLPWPILYFVNTHKALRQNLRFWFYYSVVTSYGLLPLLWLLFDQKISPLPIQKLKACFFIERGTNERRTLLNDE